MIKTATINNGTLLIKKNSIKAIIASTKKETEKILRENGIHYSVANGGV